MINTDSSHTSFCRFARAEVLRKFVAQPPEVPRLTSADLEGGWSNAYLPPVSATSASAMDQQGGDRAAGRTVAQRSNMGGVASKRRRCSVEFRELPRHLLDHGHVTRGIVTFDDPEASEIRVTYFPGGRLCSLNLYDVRFAIKRIGSEPIAGAHQWL